MNKGQRVSITSKYLRAIRGLGLSRGESPITLAVKYLQDTHKTRALRISESSNDYLDDHANVMREVIAANKDKIPKKTRRAKISFLESYEWRKLRMQALLKYGPKCMCCGATPKTGAVMNVDHIKPRNTHPELALTLDNLQILCSECNHGKGNWDQTDWRSIA